MSVGEVRGRLYAGADKMRQVRDSGITRNIGDVVAILGGLVEQLQEVGEDLVTAKRMAYQRRPGAALVMCKEGATLIGNAIGDASNNPDAIIAAGAAAVANELLEGVHRDYEGGVSGIEDSLESIGYLLNILDNTLGRFEGAHEGAEQFDAAATIAADNAEAFADGM